MKYLLLILLISGCCLTTRSEPQFMEQQKVTYPVVHYYQKVCSGHGIILNTGTDDSGRWYIVNEKGIDCPNQIVYESKLKSDE